MHVIACVTALSAAAAAAAAVCALYILYYILPNLQSGPTCNCARASADLFPYLVPMEQPGNGLYERRSA
jgi:hypothetical protein